MGFSVQFSINSRKGVGAHCFSIPSMGGSSWSGCHVVCHCDNQAVVEDMQSRSNKHKGMIHLL